MVTAEFNGDIVEVSWTSNISEVITGFTVFYEGDDGSQGSKSIPKEEEEVSLEGLSKCVFYKIKVMATSVYSYSENSTAIGVSPKPCCGKHFLFKLDSLVTVKIINFHHHRFKPDVSASIFTCSPL